MKNQQKIFILKELEGISKFIFQYFQNEQHT